MSKCKMYLIEILLKTIQSEMYNKQYLNCFKFVFLYASITPQSVLISLFLSFILYYYK